MQGVGGNDARYLKQGDEGHINQQFLTDRRGGVRGRGSVQEKIS